MAYFWTKTFHLLFVIAWMAAVFYLPRILVNVAEAGEVTAVRERLVLMGQRLYRFGHVMFALTAFFGLGLWFHFHMTGSWLHIKLTLVALLIAYFILCGKWLKHAALGGAVPSAKKLRWINELPVLLLLGVIYLVIAKPL